MSQIVLAPVTAAHVVVEEEINSVDLVHQPGSVAPSSVPGAVESPAIPTSDEAASSCLPQPELAPVPAASEITIPSDLVADKTRVTKMADKSSSATDVKSAPDGADAPERMNELTAKFTEREWGALKEFRTRIPELLEKAYPDKENARKTPITLWGVPIDPNDLHGDPRVSVILMKFLRARNLSISDAGEQLTSTLCWRETFNIKAALEEDFPQDVFGNLAHISGKDNEGRLVVYNIYGGNQDLKAVFGDVQRFIRWRVALMEKSVMQLDFIHHDQMIQVHDYEGVSLTSRDANSKAAATEATNIFQNHYPEMLFKKFFINVPTLLNWIFWLFKPIISANTMAKMCVVGTGKQSIKKELSEYISTSQIPTRYGGEGEIF